MAEVQQPITPFHDAMVPVCQRPGYRLLFEQSHGLTWAHCDVLMPWTAALKRELIQDVEAVKELHGGDIFILTAEQDVKLQKFIGMIGFFHVPGSDFTDNQGINRRIYISPRKQTGRRDGKPIQRRLEDNNSEG